MRRVLIKHTAFRGLLVLAAAIAVGCSDVTSPKPPAGSRQIVFIGRVEYPGRVIGNPAIYTVRPDGSGLRLLTYGLGQALYPAWSRDGSRIAFVSGITAGSELWLMSPDGSNAHLASAQLPTCGYGWTSITWAPDGNRLAGECFWHVSVFDLNADTARSVTDPLQATLVDPDWSPNSDWLAVGDPFSPDLSRVSVDGTQRLLLLSNAADPSWSPDGQRIAFMGGAGQPNGIYIANADGSGRTRVTVPDSAYDEGPTWSPDGQWIAFHRVSTLCADVGSPPARTCIPHWSVYVVRQDGAGLRRLTPDTLQASRPSW